MGLSESILNHTITCCQNICEEVDCEIKSCCCETRYSNSSSPKRAKSKESQTNDSDSDNK